MATPEPFAAVVLAAGASRRFGDETKQLASWDGEPLVRRAARTALAAGCRPVVVVVGHRGAEVAAAVADLAVRIRENGRWEDGQSTSVRAGLAAVPDTAPGVLFVPCDQPRLTVGVLRRLIGAAGNGEPDAVVPVVAGRRRAPVLFTRRAFGRLATVTGDAGGRQVLDRLDAVHEVSFGDPEPFADVDTPEALDALRRRDRLAGQEEET
jgi:molybdenum cofactor cytidylyltransferase